MVVITEIILTEKERLAVERGKQALKKNPDKITDKDLGRIAGVENAVFLAISRGLKSVIEE